MDSMIPGFVYSITVSILLYAYLCRWCKASFCWYGGIVYVILSCGFVFFKGRAWLPGPVYISLAIILLTICGVIFLRCGFLKSFALSSLLICIYSIIEGIMQSIIYWILSGVNSELFLQYADMIRNAAVLVILFPVFRFVIRSFSSAIQNNRLSMLPILIVPVLFITLMETFISDSVYGNTIIWDTTRGLIYPQINNIELLLLRVFACGGLFSTLVAYQKLGITIQHEQAINLLEQQAHYQESYIREAQGRYEQTRSFRHDIKNHFLVLHQLLQEGKANEAHQYLENLEKISDGLSFPVKTGNTAVDALLSSKLALAAQNGIQVHCSIHIPEQSLVRDIDWCIVLANALDNAINACQQISNKDQWIQLSGGQKGNLYLLNIENTCSENTPFPTEGIGLSNIKTVLQKYNGKVGIEIMDGVFKVNALFILPQQLRDIPQQIY